MLEELVEVLKDCNTAIMADDAYGSILFVNYLISAMCEEEVTFVVYSETVSNKLGKILRYLQSNPCVKALIDSVSVVKIGKNNRIDFGKLVAFIEDRGNLVDMAVEAGRVIRELGKTTFIFGLNVGILSFKTNEVVRAMDELLSKFDKTTFFVITGTKHLDLIANLFDVVIRIEKLEILGNIYNVYVEHSVVPTLEHVPLYRMDESDLYEI